ncbi:MAG: hypothetical protein HY862_04925 [Chloroflexi bacterium]|nr:hypothetical protein [Chloroflexota bacterium]
MLTQLLAENIGVSQSDIQALTRLSRAELYENPTYQNLVNDLDFDLLHETLPIARKVYESTLPAVIEAISDTYRYKGRGMTAFTLGNWLVGFLSQPDQLYQLVEYHNRVPLQVIEEGLPMILKSLGEMEAGGTEWTKAMAVLSLPFFAAK